MRELCKVLKSIKIHSDFGLQALMMVRCFDIVKCKCKIETRLFILKNQYQINAFRHFVMYKIRHIVAVE